MPVRNVRKVYDLSSFNMDTGVSACANIDVVILYCVMHFYT